MNRGVEVVEVDPFGDVYGNSGNVWMREGDKPVNPNAIYFRPLGLNAKTQVLKTSKPTTHTHEGQSDIVSNAIHRLFYSINKC